MTDFRVYYKKKTLGFGNSVECRFLCTERQVENRKIRRDEMFAKFRACTETEQSIFDSNESVVTVELDRKARLMKWKQERDLKRKLQQQMKKPVFKVGIVHHSLCSPVFKVTSTLVKPHYNKSCNIVKKQATLPRRTTKAIEKQLVVKLAAGSKSKIIDRSAKQTARSRIKELKTGKSKKVNILSARKNVNNQSFTPENYKFKDPSKLCMLPLFGRAALQTEQKNVNIEEITSRIAVDEKNTFVSPKKFVHFVSLTAQSSVERAPTLQEKRDKQEYKESSVINNQSDSKSEEETGEKPDIEMLTRSYIHDESCTSSSSIESITLKLSSDEQEVLSCDKENVLNINTLSDDNCKSVVLSSESIMPSAFFSPYMAYCHEKSNTQETQQIQLGTENLPSNKVQTIDIVVKNLNICAKEEKQTSQYFKYILNQEVKRLTELCVKWTEIKSGPDITEDVQYQVNQAIGQTNLLMQNKLRTFKKLVLEYETDTGEKSVTFTDLQGFWDLVYMDIANCDFRFDTLKELKSRGWVEEQPTINKLVIKRKALVKKQVISQKHSSLYAMILAERKKKMEQQDSKAIDDNEIVKDKEQVLHSSKLNMAQYDGGIFMVASPNKSIVNKSRECNSSVFCSARRRSSLLHKTQLHQISKTTKSPLIIIKVSQMCKAPEVKLDSLITYINADQIPETNILKQMKYDSVTAFCSLKSLYKVNFDNDVTLNEFSVNEELQNKTHLDTALNTIHSYDSVATLTPEIHAEKKLTFDDDSFEETELAIQKEFDEHSNNVDKEYKNSEQNLDEKKKAFVIPVLNLITSTPISQEDNSDTVHINRSTRKNVLRRQKCVNDEDEVSQRNVEIRSRILRSQVSNQQNVSSKSFKEEKKEKKDQEQSKSTIITRRKSSSKKIVNESSNSVKKELYAFKK